MTVESFGRAIGLNGPAEVEDFCRQHADVFKVENEFVNIWPAPASNPSDVTQQIEKLTKLVVFLESKTSTFIKSKVPLAVMASGNSSVQ